jgi:hypothetical protein
VLRVPEVDVALVEIERQIRMAHPEVVTLFIKPQTAAAFKESVLRCSGAPVASPSRSALSLQRISTQAFPNRRSKHHEQARQQAIDFIAGAPIGRVSPPGEVTKAFTCLASCGIGSRLSRRLLVLFGSQHAVHRVRRLLSESNSLRRAALVVG